MVAPKKTKQEAPVKPERRPVDERGVVRRGQTGTGPSKAVPGRPRIDRTKPGMPTGPVINRNKQAGSNLQKGATGPLPFNPNRQPAGAGMTNRAAGKPKPAPKRMAPRRGLK